MARSSTPGVSRPVVCACFFLLSLLVPAGASSPRLESIIPAGVQRGREVLVRFNGERLQDAEEIYCYEPGIEISKPELVTNQTVIAICKIASDCELGEHHLRVRTATGWSEMMTFVVSPYPVILEQEPNNKLGAAQKVTGNITVEGVITNEDVDCFQFEVAKGQLICAEVQGMRLGRGAFDPRLTLFDSNGSILADVHDTWLGMQDPFLSFIAPSNGTYLIQLRDVTYAGNDKCRYLLHIGSFPRPTSVYPLGGKGGETVAFRFFSEVGGEFSQEIKLPEGAAEKFGVFAGLSGLSAPSPNWVRVSAFPNVLAASPNRDRDHATVTELSPPLALNGIISEKGEENWFRFNAVKDVALDVSVFARRLRSPLDPAIEVYDAQTKSLMSADDTVGVDSQLKFTPSSSTNYFIRIRDSMGLGGRDFVYRVEITPVEPQVSVKIPEVARNDTQSRQYIAVPRGNRFATLISAKRANFSGPLDFSIEGLPNGVTMAADRLTGDSIPLVFEAGADAPLGGKLLDLVATGTNNNGTVKGKFRQEAELVQGPNNTTFYATSVDKLCVATTKEAPFHLRMVEPKVPLVQAGSMRVEIVVERAPSFDEPIELHMVWNPPGVSSQSEATIPKGGTNVFYQLNASADAEMRHWKIAVLGHATIEGGAVYVSTQLGDLEVAAPFLSGKIETLWLNPGKSGKLTVNLQPSKPFEGKATIRLLGLPEHVTAAEKEITKDDQEVVFDVTADDRCSTGSQKNLSCAVDVMQNGQAIPHSIARGGILRIVPPKKQEAKVAATKDAKK